MWWRILVFLTVALSILAGADPPKFRLIPIEIQVNDRFERPYLVEQNTAWVGVRLAQDEKQGNKLVANHETLACAGIEYARQTQEYVKFPVQDGVAKVQFVVFEEDKSPVDYELTLIQDNTVHSLSPPIWHIGTESTRGDVKADELRAPHSKMEMAIILSFTLGSLFTTYMLFGRSLFARMLRHRRMEVGSALGWSNVLVLLSWCLTALATAAMVLFPIIVWDKLYWIYVLVPAGYLVVVLGIFGLGYVLTRS